MGQGLVVRVAVNETRTELSPFFALVHVVSLSDTHSLWFLSTRPFFHAKLPHTSHTCVLKPWTHTKKQLYSLMQCRLLLLLLLLLWQVIVARIILSPISAMALRVSHQRHLRWPGGGRGGRGSRGTLGQPPSGSGQAGGAGGAGGGAGRQAGVCRGGSIGEGGWVVRRW